MRGFTIVIIPTIFLLSIISSSVSGQWVNPKDVIKDKAVARLQQGRKELTKREKEDIKRYGYTGLEIMTYFDDNADPGHDYDRFQKFTIVNASGYIKVRLQLKKTKYYYKDNLALLTFNGIKPGDIDYKERGIDLYPPDKKGSGFISLHYLRSETVDKEAKTWMWFNNLRRIRLLPYPDNEEEFIGTDMTIDDFLEREPWEEDHLIMGEDILRGFDCVVIESKNRINPEYYLSKRVTWVEKNNFIDIHEEQFDRKGRLFKVIDKDWYQTKPWNHWVRKQWYIINLSLKTRTLHQTYDWIFDQGIKDRDFSVQGLPKEYIWRKAKNPPPAIKGVSDLPPEPKIRWEFWDKIGIKPIIKE